MGVREAIPAELADAIARECRRGKLRDAAMLARTAVALVVAAVRLSGDVTRFHAHVETTLAGGPALDRASLTELAREYRRLERALLERWNVPIANDFFVMLSFGLLKRAAERWCGDASLAPALLAGERRDDRAPSPRAPCSASPRSRRRAIASAFARELAGYLARFGDRCESELKLESPTLHDDPQPLLAAIARLRTRRYRRPGGRGRADARRRRTARARGAARPPAARLDLRAAARRGRAPGSWRARTCASNGRACSAACAASSLAMGRIAGARAACSTMRATSSTSPSTSCSATPRERGQPRAAGARRGAARRERALRSRSAAAGPLRDARSAGRAARRRAGR